MELAAIKSPSGYEKEIVEKVALLLEEMGLKVDVDDTGREFGSNSGNIIAFMKGNAGDSRQPIFLGAHLDTVRVDGEIVPVIDNGIIRNKYEYILGGDDKVAVAAIIEALRAIRENSIETGDIYIIFSISEEIGIVGAKHADMDKIKAEYGFVFDADGDVGTIYNQAPYQDSIDAVFKGKAAHAGIEPEKGINSIKAAAMAVANMKSGRIDKETTCNIGKISGGQARNIVPEKTKVMLEARSLVREKLNRVTDGMINALKQAAEKCGAGLEYDLYTEYEGFKIDEDEVPVRAAAAAIKKLGLKPEIKPSGGGSDINVYNAKGKRAVNLSAGMEDVHTADEYLKEDQLHMLARLVLEICYMQIK